jgi:hypothetical protein
MFLIQSLKFYNIIIFCSSLFYFWQVSMSKKVHLPEFCYLLSKNKAFEIHLSILRALYRVYLVF